MIQDVRVVEEGVSETLSPRHLLTPHCVYVLCLLYHVKPLTVVPAELVALDPCGPVLVVFLLEGGGENCHWVVS